MKSCHTCQLSEQECRQQTPDERMIICDRCHRCQPCTQKELKNSNNTKTKKQDSGCSKCCLRCRGCHQWIPKYLWPVIEFYGDLCRSCFHRCTDCEKWIGNSDAILKGKKRYCLKCFEKKQPKRKTIKYKLVKKKEEYGHRFVRWRVYQNLSRCLICQEDFWCCWNQKKHCSKCKRKQNRAKKVKNQS